MGTQPASALASCEPRHREVKGQDATRFNRCLHAHALSRLPAFTSRGTGPKQHLPTAVAGVTRPDGEADRIPCKGTMDLLKNNIQTENSGPPSLAALGASGFLARRPNETGMQLVSCKATRPKLPSYEHIAAALLSQI